MMIAEEQHSGLLAHVPPGVKLAALFGLSLLLFLLRAPAGLGALAALVGLAALLLSPRSVAQWLRAWPLLFTIAVVVLWTAFAESPGAALVALLRLGTLSLFATLVTTTTTIGQFIDTITRMARPLERLGLANAGDIGLAIGLVIRFIPEVRARYGAIADAHRARGLSMRLSTLVVPMVIGTLQSADDIAAAIDARSIRSENPRKKEG